PGVTGDARKVELGPSILQGELEVADPVADPAMVVDVADEELQGTDFCSPRCRHRWTQPPSTAMTWPVTNALSSDARYTKVPARSRAKPRRGRDWRSAARCSLEARSTPISI